jgi:hypothetical protein
VREKLRTGEPAVECEPLRCSQWAPWSTEAQFALVADSELAGIEFQQTIQAALV